MKSEGLSRLKSELSWLRRKGAIKVGNESGTGNSRVCGRCQTELGLILNRGAICSSCRQRVCKECRQYGSYERDWVCLVCSKQIEIQLATGEWMNEFIRRPSRKRDKKKLSTAAEGVRKTLLRRSWSISSPTTSTCDLSTTDKPSKPKPPQKPPRRSSSGENASSAGEEPPSKPPRRNSMSSFDGIFPRSVLGFNRPNSSSFRGSPSPSPGARAGTLKAQSTTQQHINPNSNTPKYFFGSEPYREAPRPSTLPRRPRQQQRPVSLEGLETDSSRFHSIPRTREHRSPSGLRGRSEPAPLNNLHYVSSGPVTTTPISPSTSNGPSFPPLTQETVVLRSSPRRSEDGSSYALGNQPETLVRGTAARRSDNDRWSRGDYWALTGNGISGERNQRENERGSTAPQIRRLKIRKAIPFHPYTGSSSPGGSPESSDAGDSPIDRRPRRSQLPRSNTSITSGFSSTGRPKRAFSAPVRRCKSFQAGTSRRSLEEELSPRKVSGSQVAKFVLELEKGIRQTVVNMNPKKGGPGDALSDVPFVLPQRTSPIPSRSSSCGDKSSSGRRSTLSGSDIGLDPSSRVAPEGNDYKIVFISSDSSKDSELNSSMESDPSLSTSSLRRNPLHRRSLDSSFFRSGNKLVDVAVMTEGGEPTSSEEEEDLSSMAPQRPSSPELGSITDVPKEEDVPPGVRHTPKMFSGYLDDRHLILPLNALHPNELDLMLQQTEVVQAEAQALQKALMGAFDPQEAPGAWMGVSKGDSRPRVKGKYDFNLSPPSHHSTDLRPTRLSKNVKTSTPPATHPPLHMRGLKSSCGSQTNSCSVQNDYENVQVFRDESEQNLYQNVNFRSDILKPIVVCKSVCTQTDPVPIRSEEEEEEEGSSSGTSDYSDVSCDSLNDEAQRMPREKLGHEAKMFRLTNQSHAQPTYLTRVPTSSHDYPIKEPNERSSRGEGQESRSPPPLFAYLPPPATLPPSPNVHLRFASERDSSPVSFAAECESVRDKFAVLRDRAAASSPSEPGKNALPRSPPHSVSSLTKGNPKCESAFEIKSSFVSRAQLPRLTKNNVPSERLPPDLTSGGNNSLHLPTPDRSSKIISHGLRTPDEGNAAAMSSPSVPAATPPSDQGLGQESPPPPPQGNVNAEEEVILTEEILPSSEGYEAVTELPSSGTSEGEDTDEEVHVSRSYDVSKFAKNDSDSEGESSIPSEAAKDTSTDSGSDTDEEKTLCDEYDVTQVSSESESENVRKTSGETKGNDNKGRIKGNKNKKLFGAITVNKINKKSVKSDKTEVGGSVNVIKNDVTECVVNSDENNVINEGKMNVSDCEPSEIENCDDDNDSLMNSETFNEISDSLETVQKTDLPECDQAMESSVLVCSEENDVRRFEKTKNDPPILDSGSEEISPMRESKGEVEAEVRVSFDVSDSVVENKSETESNLGMESDAFDSNAETGQKFADPEAEQLSKDDKETLAQQDASPHPFEEDKIQNEDKDNVSVTEDNHEFTSDNEIIPDKGEKIAANEEDVGQRRDSHLEGVEGEENSAEGSELAHSESLSKACSVDSLDSLMESDGKDDENKCEETESVPNLSENLKEETKEGEEESVNECEKERVEEVTDANLCELGDGATLLTQDSETGLRPESPKEIVPEKLESPDDDAQTSQQQSSVEEAEPKKEEEEEGPIQKTLPVESDDFKNRTDSLDRKLSNCSECNSTEITGSEVAERESGSCSHEAVSRGTLSGSHEDEEDSVFGKSDISASSATPVCDLKGEEQDEKVHGSGTDKVLSQELGFKEVLSSSESGHSSGGESDVEPPKETENVVKINVAEGKNGKPSGEGHAPLAVESQLKQETRKGSFQKLKAHSKLAKGFTPPVPLRKAKRSTSSDGLSSSSDIDRSDPDASDSADTVIENTKIQSKNQKSSKRSLFEEANRDSDGPSSADSVLQGADSESQCSDGSEEGNLITIVAVGEETLPRPASQGKIYIRSDSTDSDVQIKPTCIVVTGSSGVESGDEYENEERSKDSMPEAGNDVTILEVTSDHRKDHVMSVRVTSPDSSRSASPARKSNVSELQSMILTTRERQQQFRRSPTEVKESSSLTNYFTVTLGTESPATPRRLNKTPEVRRRKLPERETPTEKASPLPPPPTSLTPTSLTPTPTLTPSPSHSPSPTLTPTPNYGEGDAVYEEQRVTNIDTTPDKEQNIDDDMVFEGYYDDYYDQYNAYNDGEMAHEGDGTFDSIEDAESVGESNCSETSSEEAFEREEELRGYCKRGIDFTLHTIIEESCEESDYDKKLQEDDSLKRDQSELEKYFYFGLGNGPAESKKFANEESEYSDSFSETSSSIYSEGMESLDCKEEIDPEELASSRLEKYFSGFSGFERRPSIRSVGEESEIHTDESGSVGSDSEGSSSPEQPRKKLFRSRGVRSVSSSRSHGYSSDKGDGVISDGSHHSGDGDLDDKVLVSGEDEGSTESEETAFDKGDGQFDTIKRRKKKKILSDSSEKKIDSEKSEFKFFNIETKDDDYNSRFFGEYEAKKSSEDHSLSKEKSEEATESDLAGRKYQSRDSGFIGSSDDLLKDKPEDVAAKEPESKEKQSSDLGSEEIVSKKLTDKETLAKDLGSRSDVAKPGSPDNDANNNKSENEERSSNEGKVSRSSTGSSVDLPPYSQSKGSHNLSRKDSFNNWSSDEETNIMMNKMRVFFKNMFSNVGKESQKGQRVKSPQLVMFEAKLTNLMRSVPGINDEQVKEIVEYLSSEETWSDSYDSSDYTSSDLEGAYARLDQADPKLKSELQEQISASCQQIIKNFDQSREPSDTDSTYSLFGGRANSESSEASSKDTAFVCQRLMSSITRNKTDSDKGSIGSGSRSTSPPLLMKVMPFIRDRLVALMHEVSAGSENGDDIDSFNGANAITSSPRQKLFLPKKHSLLDNISLDSSVDKSSLTSTSFESEDSPTDTEQSPESETGTPKIFRRQKLSIISERSSTEDFTSIESQRTVFSSHDSPRYHFRSDSSKLPYSAPSQRSLEDRSGPASLPFGRNREDDRLGTREHVGLSKASRSGRRPEARKAKSHLSLEKIHHEEVKTTGERSESLGDLLDRVRSSSEFSSSYEQLDSDSTLKASDSLDRHIGSSSSNVRLNASSRGSLTTSSRGSLATSSRGSLNASSRGSLQGSSGPEEEDERKAKKLSFFKYARRSSVPDASKDAPSPEVRSTTLPRSTPAQILTTGTLPRSQSSQGPPSRSPSSLQTSHSSTGSTDRPSGYHIGGPRSARYHPPGYRPPPAGLPPKRTYSTPSLRKDKLWPSSDESGPGLDDSLSTNSSVTGVIATRVPPPPSRITRMGGTSPIGSSHGGSLGRTSAGTESVGGSLASFENSPDEDDPKRRDSDGGRSPFIALGPKSRSESLASVYSSGGEGRFSVVAVQGEVRVALQYNYKEGQLECHIIQCRDLAPVDTKRNRSDPYVKGYLLPDKSKSGKRKTKVKRHTLNPVFDEFFKFATTLSELESRTLCISVWHSDMFGRNVFMGEVNIPLSDALFEDSVPRWYTLLDRNEPMEDLNYGAVLIIALKFVPPDVLLMSGSAGCSKRSKRSRGALQVRVKEASGLSGVKNQSPPDPICKGILMPEKGKSSKQKTTVIRKTSNPKWNHTMTFDDVTLQELTEKSLELSIFNHDRFGSSEFLGGCRLNLGKGHHNNKIVEWLDASGLEQKLWEQMLDRPNLWVESSILLRPSIDRPIYSSAFTD